MTEQKSIHASVIQFCGPAASLSFFLRWPEWCSAVVHVFQVLPHSVFLDTCNFYVLALFKGLLLFSLFHALSYCTLVQIQSSCNLCTASQILFPVSSSTLTYVFCPAFIVLKKKCGYSRSAQVSDTKNKWEKCLCSFLRFNIVPLAVTPIHSAAAWGTVWTWLWLD